MYINVTMLERFKLGFDGLLKYGILEYVGSILSGAMDEDRLRTI